MISLYKHFVLIAFATLPIIHSGIAHGNRGQRPGWNNGGSRGNFGRRPGQHFNHHRPELQNYGQHGQNFGHQFQQNFGICPPPEFNDDTASFEVEECEKKFQNQNQGCFWNGRIPAQWKGTMTCQKGLTSLKYTTTCSQDGIWNPAFPESCLELIEMQGFLPTNGNGNGNYPQQSARKRDCMEFRVRLTENFELNCFIPGFDGEVENCFNHRKTVPSGTKLILKCKPPYKSGNNGPYPEWLCDDGHWPNEKSKLLCTYSSMNGRPLNQGLQNGGYQTTQKPIYPPYPVTTNNPYFVWNSVGVPESTTDNVIKNPYETGIISTTVPTMFPPTTYPTKKPLAVTPGWNWNMVQPPSVAPIIPIVISPITSTSVSISTKCPALTHIAPGVKLECVSSEQGLSSTKCDFPLPKGSEAKYSCEDYHESTYGLNTLFRKCKDDGTWTGNSESFTCIPQCGRGNIVRVPYITSGLPTVRGQWPWHAGIFLYIEKSDKWSFICGGTLVTKRAILTAAHCVTLVQTTEIREKISFRIDLGKYERDQNDDLVQVKHVLEIKVHPSYNAYGYDSDIAIIILESEIDIGYHVRPICFPLTSDTALEELQLTENSIGTVVGWGYDENQELASSLRMAKLKVIGRRECSQTDSGGSTNPIQARSTTYCAGFQNGTNVCNGDSGGGMYFNSKDSEDHTRWYLQGIVSVGIADEDRKCDPKQYSIFTRVGRYSDWITRILTENDAI